MELLYWVLFVCSASYAFNRKSVVFSMANFKMDLEDASHAGLIVSCQNVAFAISTFIAGVLSDRIHPNILFSVGMLISGYATITFSSTSSITTFCGLWFLNGLAQGCGWPACAKILSQRASPSQFGTLWSFLSCSNNFSGSLGPFLSAFIVVQFGWRWNVFTAGFLTLFLCAVFLYVVPFSSVNKNIKPEETQTASSEKKADEQGSLSDLFHDPFIWLLSISFMVVFCARTTTVDWGQMYLVEEKHHNQYVASAFISSVEIGGSIGRMVAGYLTDWLIKRNAANPQKRSPHWKPLLRMSVALIFVLGSVACIHLFRGLDETSSSTLITSIGALMGLCYYGPVAIFGIVSAECVPPHLSGSSHAIVALFGNIGATISGLPFSYIAKYYGWSSVFLLLEILAAGTFLAMFRCKNLTPKVVKDKEG